MERCDDTDPIVACIARKLLATFTVLEKRITSAASSKKSLANKIQTQKADLMKLMYEVCKVMVRRSKKRILMDKLDADWFKKDLGEDVLLALSKVVVEAQQGGRATEPHGVGMKRHLPEPPAAAKMPRVDGGSNRQEKIKAVEAKEKELAEQLRIGSPSQVVSWIDNQFANAAVRPVMGTIMSKICKNCISGGRGLQRHTRAQCEAAGNPPTEPCSVCARSGHTAYHWRSQCKWQQ